MYDAWGNCSVNVIDSTAATVANLNPFRYRSYYLDTETNIYFLKTRYYAPEIGRFMTIDGVSYLNPDSVNGLNLYAYCGNNPANYVDHAGESAIGIASLILLVVSIVLILTASESRTVEVLQGLTDTVDMGLVAGEFYESTQAHNKYIYAYSAAVVEYRSTGVIPWNDMLDEAFKSDKEMYISCLERDSEYIEIYYTYIVKNPSCMTDIDRLCDDFPDWAKSTYGIIASNAGGGTTNKGYNVIEKILGLLTGIAR